MTRHYAEELQDLLDGRLDSAAGAEVEAHLDGCPACRSEYERLRWVKAAIASVEDHQDVPAGLAARVSAAIDTEDRSTASGGSTLRPADAVPQRAPRWRWRWAAALAAAVVMAAGVALWRLGGPPDMPTALAQDFVRYQRKALPLAMDTNDTARLEAFFQTAHLGFTPRVLDLRMMGYSLVGGGVQEVRNQETALLVYRTDSGQIVLCFMFPGEATAVARGAARRSHAGIDFFVRQMSGVTVVLWQEGLVTCALVGDGDPEAVVQLAFAKAMKTP